MDNGQQNKGKKNKIDWNFGTYFSGKKKKLIEQFEESKELYQNKNDQNTNPRLFENIGIYVNGFTNPTASELKILMMRYGGEFHEYTNDRVTHIIAANLAATKINHMRNKTVVKPEWIVDCIKENKILNSEPYSVLNQDKNQNKLNEFMDKKVNKTVVSKTEDKVEIQHVKPSTSDGKTTNDAKDENFLNKFYEKSRLHLISTLATDMKLYINNLRNSNVNLKSIPEHVYNKEQIVLNENEKVFFHVDIDCFFVSVSLRDKPHLQDQPVAVAHSKGDRPLHSKDDFSYSEVASCNYIARQYGLYNGMLVGEALSLCPNLKLISYDFEQYATCSKQIYELIGQYTHQIKAISCDEMFIDFTDLILKSKLLLSPLNLASFIRNEIKEQIKCPSSIGIGTNMLLARMATKKAKPNGQVWIRSGEETLNFIASINISDLPGIGSSTMYKLNSKWNVKTCSDLRKINKSSLQELFGSKIGAKLYEFCRGIDPRPFLDNENSNETNECVKKSVSTDVNYGIRFDTIEQVNDFFDRLSNELAERLKKYNLKGSKLTLKVRIRDPKAPIQTKKYLGCGLCIEKTVSTPINTTTNDSKVISTFCKTLFQKHFLTSVDCKDLRGFGLQMDRLKSSNSTVLPIENCLTRIIDKQKYKHDKSAIQTSTTEVISLIDEESNSSESTEINKQNYFEQYKRFTDKLVEYKNNLKIKESNENQDYDAIKYVLNDWICWTSNLLNNQYIDEEDIEILRGYLLYLLNTNESYDKLVAILKILKTLISQSGSMQWVQIYKQFYREIQTDFYLKYNSILQLND